jgi:peptidoglycan/LPS O-acetylase OafA/YrhL
MAALAVFAYHLHPWPVLPALWPLQYGYTGVTVFFVLSGFILTWTHQPAQTRRQFYWRRFARIYPAYAVVTAAVLAWSLVAGQPRDPSAIVTNLTLTHAWFTDPGIYAGINGVSWSLSCELLFYAAFPAIWVVAVRLTDRGLWVLTGVAFGAYAIVAVAVVHATTERGVLQILYANPVARLPEFLVGIAVARLLITGARLPAGLGLAAIGFAVVGAFALPQWPVANVWATPVAAAGIVWLARRDLAGRNRALRRPWLQFAGRVSYAFYLVHGLILLRLEHHSLAGRAVVGLVCAGLAAVALHLLVEVPANRRLTARRKPGHLPQRSGLGRAA